MGYNCGHPELGRFSLMTFGISRMICQLKRNCSPGKDRATLIRHGRDRIQAEGCSGLPDHTVEKMMEMIL